MGKTKISIKINHFMSIDQAAIQAEITSIYEELDLLKKTLIEIDLADAKKAKRGRPRKTATTEPPAPPKRGRGRPRKNT